MQKTKKNSIKWAIIYTNLDADFSGILSNQNGKDNYTCYGDYYFMELLRNFRGSKFDIW